jgi:hypothetical protein
MGIKRVLLASLVIAGTATPAFAQLGAAFGVRSVSFGENNSEQADRSGYEVRGFIDGVATRRIGWRVELAFTQMQYQHDIGIDVRKVSENGLEFAVLAGAEAANGALTGTYVVAGPLASARLTCGASGGFVDCVEGATQRLGYVLGVGYKTNITPRRYLMFEVRYLGNAVSGAGGGVVALTIGLRVARR